MVIHLSCTFPWHCWTGHLHHMFRWCYWVCIWTMLPNHSATCYFRMSDSWRSKEASCRLVPFAGSPLCELDTLQTLNISLTWRWMQLQKPVDLLYMGFCQFLYKQKNRDHVYNWVHLQLYLWFTGLVCNNIDSTQHISRFKTSNLRNSI